MMSRGRAPTYTLSSNHSISVSSSEHKVLETGTFLRPLQPQYVPKHVLQDHRWRYLAEDRDYVFCYTHYGIIPIPKSLIRESP